MTEDRLVQLSNKYSPLIMTQVPHSTVVSLSRTSNERMSAFLLTLTFGFRSKTLWAIDTHTHTHTHTHTWAVTYRNCCKIQNYLKTKNKNYF